MSVTAKYLLSILLLLQTIAVWGQEFVFTNISEQISLPSLECYNVMQDSQGYIWISTEQGLVQYNGLSSEIFNNKNGLPEKAVYATLEYPKGKMWFATSKHRLLNYSGGKLSEARLSKSYQQKMALASRPNYTYALTASNNNVYLNSARALFKIDTNGRTLSEIYTTKVNANVNLRYTDDKLLVISPKISTQQKGRYTSWQKKITILLESPSGDKQIVFPFNGEEKQTQWRILTAKAKGLFFFSYDDKLVCVNPDLSYETFTLPGMIISLYADRDGGLWVGTIKQGVYYYDLSNQDKQPIISLKNYSVSGICQDRENNIWCTTLEDGVFLLKNKLVVSYQNIPGLSVSPTLLKEVGGTLWVSSPNYGLQYFDSRNNDFKRFGNLKNTFYYAWQNENHQFLASDAGIYALDKSGKKVYKSSYGQGRANMVLNGVITSSKELYLINYSYIYKYNSNVQTHYNDKIRLKSIGKCIQYLNDRLLIYGCGNGLFLLETRTNTSKKIEGINQSVTQILRTREGKLWICTKGNGLFVYEKGTLKRMDKKLKIPTNIFNDIAEDGYGNLWLGTNIGIVKIYKKDGIYFKTETYTTVHGLPSKEVYKVAPVQNHLFFSTSKGIAKIPLNISLKNNVPPLFSVADIKSNDIPVFADNIVLPYKNNKLGISFNVFQYKANDKRFYYSLDAKQPYIAASGHMLQLQHLAPGDYQLSAYAVNSDGIRSENTVELNFTVKKPFWQQWWFIALVLISVALSAWFIKKLQTEHIHKKETEKNRINSLIAESKLSALQARMNPHFIFNAINSIQNYIFKNQPEQARAYLTKFSRLIRLILQQSGDKFITLDQEIQTLKLYIELEQLRFKQAFNFVFSVSPDLPLRQLYVPAMLVQPYVENAIWHGLMNLKGKRTGNLQISIRMLNNNLLITIEDNGIGREKAVEFAKSKYYISSGMMLTEDRMKILRKIYQSSFFKVEVTDLYDDYRQATGTRVTITLSVLQNDIIN